MLGSPLASVDVNVNSRNSAQKAKVSKQYQKKSHLEHIKERPDTYIGSTESREEELFVWNSDTKRMEKRAVSFVPGLYKIFDEILVNAADNKRRDDSMKYIKVTINPELGEISVENDGNGIPVEVHETEGVYIPQMVFGELLTGDNYDDSEDRVVGGRNGYGAKLANIFSTSFTVETADSSSGKRYKQTWTDNMDHVGKPSIKKMTKKQKDFTKVTFAPDFSRFGCDGIDVDHFALLSKRVYDMAGTTPRDVKVYLNGDKLDVVDFKSYCRLYFAPTPEELAAQAAEEAEKAKSYLDDDEEYIPGGAKKKAKKKRAPKKKDKFIYEKINERWEVCIAVSRDQQQQQVSFCNSICTSKGGEHVKWIADDVAKKIIPLAKKAFKGVDIKASQIKHSMFIFINALISNPSFDSQTKETLTTRHSKFGPAEFKPKLSEKFCKDVVKNSDLVDEVLHYARAKVRRAMERKMGGSKKSKLSGIPKLDDANNAGGRKSKNCTLILTEGDSAKSLAIAGLSVIGRDNYGVFPLKGKLLNVRDATSAQVMKNSEIQNIMKIMGLNIGRTYSDTSKLRYGHIMIMTDQDHDGSHIKGLIINFIHHYWPSLLEIPNFLQVFITPIVKCVPKTGSKAKKKKNTVTFYTTPEYEAWQSEDASHRDGKKWRIKYYKGLGTSDANEAREYFASLEKNLIPFTTLSTDPTGPAMAGSLIDMCFSKKKVEDRKLWIGGYQAGTHIDFDVSEMAYSEFVNKEYIIMAVQSNLRGIPHVMDGLKPSQRKILFACLKRKLHSEIKVAQLAGYTSEHAAYHHGEMSLNGAIINMAQNYVGSNNINLLMPNGQFGTRLMGGKDHASPRYVFTQLERLTELIFHPDDAALYDYLEDDGQSIEPEFYVPVIPLLLVNGGNGIGTGWSSSVPNYNPEDIIANLRMLIARVTTGEVTEMRKKDSIGEDDNAEDVSNGDEYEEVTVQHDVKAPHELNLDDVAEMIPWYNGFVGHITEIEQKQTKSSKRKRQEDGSLCKKFAVKGVWSWEDEDAHREAGTVPTTLKITELPVGTWVNNYKEFLETSMEAAEDKTSKNVKAKKTATKKKKKDAESEDEGEEWTADDASKKKKKAAAKTKKGSFGSMAFKEGDIQDLRCNHTDTKVSFTLKLSETFAATLFNDDERLVKQFKLQSVIDTGNMHAFASDGTIKRYANEREILLDFFHRRLSLYAKRKAQMLDQLTEAFERVDNKVRFILAVVNGELLINNRKKSDILSELREKEYKPFPPASSKKQHNSGATTDDDDEDQDAKESSKDYDYLLSMPLWNLTLEKVKKLKKERAEKNDQLNTLRATAETDIWLEDLSAIEDAWEKSKAEKAKNDKESARLRRMSQGGKKKKGSRGKKKVAKKKVIKDDSDEEDEWCPPAAKSKSKKTKAAAKKKKAAKVTAVPVAPAAKEKPAVKKPVTKPKRKLGLKKDFFASLDNMLVSDDSDDDNDDDFMLGLGLSGLSGLSGGLGAGIGRSKTKKATSKKSKKKPEVTKKDPMDLDDIAEALPANERKVGGKIKRNPRVDKILVNQKEAMSPSARSPAAKKVRSESPMVPVQDANVVEDPLPAPVRRRGGRQRKVISYAESSGEDESEFEPDEEEEDDDSDWE